MTDKLRDAAQLALEWVEDASVVLSHVSTAIQGGVGAEAEGVGGCSVKVVDALRAALAQQDAQAVPSDLVDKLRKFRGLPPHNNSSNVCQGDGYFYASIEAQYTSDQIAAANDILNAAPTPPAQQPEARKWTGLTGIGVYFAILAAGSPPPPMSEEFFKWCEKFADAIEANLKERNA